MFIIDKILIKLLRKDCIMMNKKIISLILGLMCVVLSYGITVQIKTMNGTINSSTVLSEEEKKEEKKYLMEVIKRVKTRINEIHSKSEEAKQDAPEMKIVNGKETMRIQIKK